MPKEGAPAQWTWGTSLNGPMNLGEIKAAGIDCIEVVLNGKRFTQDWKTATAHYQSIVEQAKRAGLTVFSMHLPYGHAWDISHLNGVQREQIVQAHAQLLKHAQQWGIHCAVIHPSYEPIQLAERPKRLAVSRDALKTLGTNARTLGVQLAAECLPRTCLGNTGDEMEQLLQGNDDVAVCCDVNHLLQEKPAAFIRRLGKRVVTLHLSDNDGVDERHWLPGDGIIDWRDVIAALTEVGYDGPFIIEVKNPHPRTIAKCLHRLFGRI
ncbi:sugar phosphate isomerase/epimerase family protein [Numidum massiliense]|uniref:sugar phosphate isomerase/epimerase family protein n=1 Tax=Numidum massiliense TaxID=1522315 RepID=UPI0006D53A0D|nr:sugar phosphate isomerase/epimerase family protein [Numidum massiliense]